MPTYPLPAGAIPAELPQRVPLQIVAPNTEPPDGDGWPHEVKHDGHRLLAIIAGDDLRLASRKMGTTAHAVPRALPGG